MSNLTYPVLLTPDTDPLLRAAAAYLARYKGATRTHSESDLRIWFQWCADHHLEPLQAQRVHIELYLRWMLHLRIERPPV